MFLCICVRCGGVCLLHYRRIYLHSKPSNIRELAGVSVPVCVRVFRSLFYLFRTRYFSFGSFVLFIPLLFTFSPMFFFV